MAAARVPKLVSGVGDMRKLPLAPVDGFVLSRINGTMSVREIASNTGLGEDVVEGSLAKLESLGIVEFPNGGGAQPSAVAPGRTAPAGAAGPTPQAGATGLTPQAGAPGARECLQRRTRAPQSSCFRRSRCT